jgi:hypothetical protein
VRATVVPRRQRPRALAAQVAVDLDLQRARRIERHDPRLGPQVVGQPALEVLARDLADLGLAVRVDLEVDGPPPLGVAAAVGQRVEHSVGRRGHIPLVDEHVLARSGAQHGVRDLLLHGQRRLRGVARIGVVADELRRGHGLGPAAAHELALGAHLRQALEELLGRPSGAGLDAHAAGAIAGGALGVDGAARHRHRLARAQDVLAPPDAELHRPLDHLQALDLVRVHVRLRQEAPRPSDHVRLDDLPTGLGGGPPKLHAQAQRLQVQHISRLGHAFLLHEDESKLATYCAAPATADQRARDRARRVN